MKKIKEWWYKREYKERRWYYDRKTGYPKPWFNGNESFKYRLSLYFEVAIIYLIIFSPFIAFFIAPFINK